MLQLSKRFNNIKLADLHGYLPFMMGRTKIGTVPPEIVAEMKAEPFRCTFTVTDETVQLHKDLGLAVLMVYVQPNSDLLFSSS